MESEYVIIIVLLLVIIYLIFNDHVRHRFTKKGAADPNNAPVPVVAVPVTAPVAAQVAASTTAATAAAAERMTRYRR